METYILEVIDFGGTLSLDTLEGSIESEGGTVHGRSDLGSVTTRTGRVVPVLGLIVSGVRDTVVHGLGCSHGWVSVIRPTV